MKQTKAPQSTPSPSKQDSRSSREVEKSPGSVFIGMALDMTWRLAIVVLVPIIAGFKLDEHFKLTPLLTIIGFVVAIAGVALVLKQTVQAAGSIPVNKKDKD
jgi:F0F1-type ATP synthase assembly protein I